MRTQATRTARAEVKPEILSKKFDQKSMSQKKKKKKDDSYKQDCKRHDGTKLNKLKRLSGSPSCETCHLDFTKTKFLFESAVTARCCLSSHIHRKAGVTGQVKGHKITLHNTFISLPQTNKNKNLQTTIQ